MSAESEWESAQLRRYMAGEDAALREQAFREEVEAPFRREIEDLQEKLDDQLRQTEQARTTRREFQRLAKEKHEKDAAEIAALRLAFAEASHNAGPAFVAHETLNRYRDALTEIEKGEGPFKTDQLEFASAVIENLTGIARAALKEDLKL